MPKVCVNGRHARTRRFCPTAKNLDGIHSDLHQLEVLTADPLAFNDALKIESPGDRRRLVDAGLVGDDPDADEVSGICPSVRRIWVSRTILGDKGGNATPVGHEILGQPSKAAPVADKDSIRRLGIQ